jgi:hypothetical protein
MEQKRQFYRVEYPKSVRPTFLCEGHKYPVIDLSEEGVGLEVTKSGNFRVGQLIVGEVVFHDHGQEKITASVLREDSRRVILKCHVGVSLARIMEEQRYLINRFGGVRRSDDDE